MRSRVGIAMVLAGCFTPAPPANAPCAPPGSPARCPSGQMCVVSGGDEICVTDDLGSSPDGGSDGAPDGAITSTDLDGDGKSNDDDNCPNTANPDQANEDGDVMGDACDPCPPFAGTADTDGDTLGDACDPAPNTAGDKLVAFVGFTGPTLPASWTRTGMFTLTTGNAALAVAGANQGATFTIAAPQSARYDIWAEGTLDSITTALGALGVVAQYQAATDDAVACQLIGNADGTSQELRLFDTAANMLVDGGPHAFVPGGRYVLHVRRDGGSYTCSATNAAAQVAGTTMFAPPMSTVGLRVRSATARYHWVMVTQSP